MADNQRACLIDEKPVKDCSLLKVFSDQQEGKHQGQTGLVLRMLLQTRLCLCVNVSVFAFVCVWAIEVDSVFSLWCFLVLSQSQSAVTEDKACLLPRQEEMELGSLEKATHHCIYIILEASLATLNSCALISEVSCLHRESCGLFREISP